MQYIHLYACTMACINVEVSCNFLGLFGWLETAGLGLRLKQPASQPPSHFKFEKNTPTSAIPGSMAPNPNWIPGS